MKQKSTNQNAIIFLLILIAPFFGFAQNSKGRLEIEFPANPWTYSLSKNYLFLVEYFGSPKTSVLVAAGHQGQNFIQSYFSNSTLTGNRIEVGFRRYYKPEEQKIFRPFLGSNFVIERSRLELKPKYSIPQDSLRSAGFTFGPNISAGFKVVILNRIALTHVLTLNYFFTTMHRNNITNNPVYWAYDDWDNSYLDWRKNREADVELWGFRRGLSPAVYLNVGIALKR